MGDVNMCSTKWKNEDFKLKTVAQELIGTLAQCGLTQVELGHTYLADRLNVMGQPIESSLDHIYISAELEDYVTFTILLIYNSACTKEFLINTYIHTYIRT